MRVGRLFPVILVSLSCLLTPVHARDSGDSFQEEFKQPKLKDRTDAWEFRGKGYQPSPSEISRMIDFMADESLKPPTQDEFGGAVDKLAEEIVGKEIKPEYSHLTYFKEDKSFDHEEWTRFMLEREWHFTGLVWEHKTYKSIQNRSLTFEEAKPAYEVLARFKLIRAMLKLYGVDMGVWEDVRPPQLPGQSQGKPGWGKGEREDRAREFGDRARKVLQMLREKFGFVKPKN